MGDISELTFDHIIDAAFQRIYKANKIDLEDLRNELEAIYIVDVNDFGLDPQQAVVECCLETYEKCAAMTADTLYQLLRDIIPWLERSIEQEVLEKLSHSPETPASRKVL